jgi:hypothetical protein
MGLYKGTVQNIITGSYMLPNADDKRKLNVSKEKVRGKTKREEVIYKEAQYTSFFGLGGLSHKEEELPEGRDMSTNIERQNIWHRYIYSFEPIPDKIQL